MGAFVPWWVLACVPVVAGTIACLVIADKSGAMDFGKPLIAIACFFIGLFCTIGILIGHAL